MLGSARWVRDNAMPTPTQWQTTPASHRAPAVATGPTEAARCEVPAFTKPIGHEAMWKLHNGC